MAVISALSTTPSSIITGGTFHPVSPVVSTVKALSATPYSSISGGIFSPAFVNTTVLPTPAIGQLTPGTGGAAGYATG